jgi:hypothetical protein
MLQASCVAPSPLSFSNFYSKLVRLSPTANRHAFIPLPTTSRLVFSLSGRRKDQTRTFPGFVHTFLVLHTHQAGPEP